MLDGEGEAARAAEIGAEIAEKGVADVTESAGRDAVNVVEGACGGGLSFVFATVVATRVGEQAIGTLKVGQQVWAYNPKTKQMELEPILHVWINHDNDLVDLTITHTNKKQGKETKPSSEVIHTNKKHPFLTMEKGFLPVGQIKLGMHVLEADGQVGVITGWKVVPGVKTMYNLEVQQDHTYTVGIGQWVVHNSSCGGFANDNKLQRHFEKHNNGFDPSFVSPEHYQATGASFMSGDRPEGALQGKLVGGHFNGDVIRYNTITNEFGMKSAGGVLRSYYKPVDGIDHFWSTMMPNGVLDMDP